MTDFTGAVFLGNLTVPQIETLLEIELTDAEREELSAARQNPSEVIAPGKWHCFNIPFIILCGDNAAYDMVVRILEPYSDKMKGTIRIAIARD